MGKLWSVVPRLAAVAVLVTGITAAQSPAAAKEFTLGLGDIESVETLGLLIAMQQAKARGVDIKLVSLKSEDIANQAVVNGQVDMASGTPYTVIQKIKAPMRMFYQLSTLQFYPVVNTQYYKTWKDLDGGDLVVHSRTSGTLAIANLVAQKQGIKYGSISYVPGSEVRALAMLKGNIKATIIDWPNTQMLMEKGEGKFAILPLGEMKASDEALFARDDFLQKNAEQVGIFVEELLKVWRAVNKNPAWAAEQRTKYGLLKDLPKDLEKDIVPYYQQGAKVGMFPNDGGGAKAAKADFDFFTVAGQLQGSAAELKVEDFWDLKPLETALKKVGN